MDGRSTTVSSLSVLLGGALLVQVMCPVSGMLVQVVVCPVSDVLVQVVVCPEGTSLVGEDKGVR